MTNYGKDLGNKHLKLWNNAILWNKSSINNDNGQYLGKCWNNLFGNLKAIESSKYFGRIDT